MKKILFYTDTPQLGGTETIMYLLAKFLDKKKYLPVLVCSNFKKLDSWCEKFIKENIPVIRLKVSGKHDFKHYLQLKKIIKNEKFDLAHLHLWNPASIRYGLFACKKTKTPYIITEHDPFELKGIKNFIKKWLIKDVKKIIAISKTNEVLLKKIFPEHKEKIFTIHDGIDTTWWRSQVLKITEEEIYDIKEKLFKSAKNTMIIFSAAELHERKGLKYLISAIPEVLSKFKNIKLIIAGEVNDRENLQNLIKTLKLEKHVNLIGKHNDIAKIMKCSNIFVLPSIREGFGLVNVEAMCTPLPVIASKTGGISEIIENEVTGILVPPEKSEELSKALIRLIENPELRKKFALFGYDRAIKHFDAKIMAENYEKIYEEITNHQ